MTARGCGFDRKGPSVLVHSRDPDLLQRVLGGRAVLSGLDGEWWMNF
jgi:hypothetical protein